MRKVIILALGLIVALMGLILIVFEPYSWYCSNDSVLAFSYQPQTSLTSVYYFGQYVEAWLSTEERAGTRYHLPNNIHAVTSIAFSPDGITLLTGSDDGIARLWDARTGKLLYTLRGHVAPLSNVAFSSDSKIVLTGSSDSIAKLWDVRTGILLHTLQGHSEAVTSAAFSPDGKIVITGGDDRTIVLWNVETGLKQTRIVGYSGPVWGIAFSPDSKILLTTSSNNI
jgi:WD40 repeat protein